MLNLQLKDVNPPIAKLPMEVLSTVFKLVLPPPFCLSERHGWHWLDSTDKDTYFPVAFGAVSTHWRSVAWSTPSLWTTLCLKLSFPADRKDAMFKFNATVLSLYLKNSINHPLRLAFYFPIPDEIQDNFDPPEVMDPSVDSLLIARMPMIQTLVLINPQTTWFRHFSTLSNLKELDIDTVEPVFDMYSVPLNACRSLRRLALDGVETTFSGRVLYKIPPSITILDLSDIPIDTCIKLVLQSPNVEEFYLRRPSEAHSDFDDSARKGWFTGQEPSLKHLKYLYWEDPELNLAWREAFLMYTQTPALRSLMITASPDSPPHVVVTPGHAQFFQQLPPTLSKLELKSVGKLSGTHYEDLFRPNSSIQHLTFTNCTLSVVLDAFNKLTTRGPGKSRSMSLLRSLSISGCLKGIPVGDDYNVVDEFPYVEPIVLMLQRRLLRGDEFRLELSQFVVEWTLKDQATLKDVVKSGVKLEIVEDSEQADWLLLD